MQFFKDKRITMLFKEYSYVGLGVYVLILKELQKGKVSIDYISVISKENGLSEEFIKSLIDDCCEKFKTKERGSLITKDENYFWSDEILKEKMKQEKSKHTLEINLTLVLLVVGGILLLAGIIAAGIYLRHNIYIILYNLRRKRQNGTPLRQSFRRRRKKRRHICASYASNRGW